MKTLDQLDAKLEKRTPITSTGAAFNITAAGSYYLTKDITFTGHGLVITADNVTIDLNGFSLAGTGAGTGSGILVSGAHKNVRVRNGTVRLFGGIGVAMSTASNSTLEDLRVADNKGAGAQIGPFATVTRCTFTANGGVGIIASSGPAITDCSASGNAGHGIQTANAAVVSRCRGLANGTDGFNLGDEADISDCVASGNKNAGIRVFGGGAIKNCVATANTVYGIYTDNGTVVTGCTARKQAFGIRVGDYATVSGCTATENTSEGIQAVSGCFIVNNNASRNGKFNTSGAGIHLFGTRNRVDSNHVADNLGPPGFDIGIWSGGGEGVDFVVRNVSVGNSPDYKPSAGTTLGPKQQPSSATSPWANF